MEEDHRPEQAPQERVFASHNGFEIGYKPTLANGWVEFETRTAISLVTSTT